MNFIGFPVTYLTDKAAPPRESPSTFVRTIPDKGNVSLKALAVLTASWPCMASTTNKVSEGDSVLCNCFNSFIIFSSMPKRPAVSKIIKSKKCFFEYSRALSAILLGLSLLDESKHSTPRSNANTFSCSIAAGL